MTTDLILVPTGTANLASVRAAFERLSIRPRLATQPRDVAEARFVVLPGVGAFAAAIERLDALGLRPALRERIGAGKPTLAICLGLQLLCDGSEESPGIAGLGCMAGTARRFESGLRVPHLGWNSVEPCAAGSIEPGDAYFAHTYRLTDVPTGWVASTTDYGGRFVSALTNRGVLACQFHPELSGAWGRRLLERWLEVGGASC